MTQVKKRLWRSSGRDAAGAAIFGWSGEARGRKDAESKAKIAMALCWAAMLDGLGARPTEATIAMAASWTTSVVRPPKGTAGNQGKGPIWTIGMTLEAAAKAVRAGSPGKRIDHEAATRGLTPYLASLAPIDYTWSVAAKFAGSDGVRIGLDTSRPLPDMSECLCEAVLAAATSQWARRSFPCGHEAILQGRQDGTPDSQTLRAARLLVLEEAEQDATLPILTWLAKIRAGEAREAP